VTWSALVLLVVYGVVVTLWKVLHVLLLFYKPRRFFLRAGAAQRDPADGPLVSILLPAKDEEENIGDCIRSIRCAAYSHFELIVIDDRSSDRTAQEALRAAEDDPRVRLLQIHDRPEGWTGKMNAVRQALALARGELVLIVDADSRHAPETLGTAVAAQERRRLDLLSLLPRVAHSGFLSRLVQPLVGAIVFFWKPLPLVNSRKYTGTAFSWGGFLLLRRSALEGVGGFEVVHDRFAADIALTGLLKRAGYRIRLLHAPELVSSTWYTTAGRMIAGWTRILRITADNRPAYLVATLLALVFLGLSAYAAIGVGLAELLRSGRGELPMLLGGMGIMHLIFQLGLLGRICRMGGTSPVYALGHLPAMLFAVFLVALTLVRSRSSQLAWRGTQYRLTSDGRASAA
jgi:chlorobactene glucosyltransferase